MSRYEEGLKIIEERWQRKDNVILATIAMEPNRG